MTRRDAVRRAILANRSPLHSLTIVLTALIVATALRVLLGRSANPVPFLTYYPAALLVAVFLGGRWGAVFTVMAAAVVNWVFFRTPWSQSPTTNQAIFLLVFVVSCLLVITVGAALRDTVRRIDELAKALELQNDEMFHRVQNTLAVVQAVVRLGGRTDPAQFREDLLGRLNAMAAANRIVREGTAASGDVSAIVASATAPFGRQDSIEIVGPSCDLTATQAHHLHLILHELGTNALKHGSLSAPSGIVRVSWKQGANGFSLNWAERGGPAVAPPERRGLGSKLLANQRSFDVAVDYEPTGLICELTQRRA